MTPEEFKICFNNQVQLCTQIMNVKGKEYAPDADRLANFKKAAALQGNTPREALCGMFVKHVVSIFDLNNLANETPVAMDIWDEKIGDALNYLFLLKAIVVEEAVVVEEAEKDAAD